MFRHLASIAFALALFSAGSAANAHYPERAVRLLVPVPPGQATDVAARLVADALSKKWKQSVFVENKPGGAAIPGMVAGKEAAPDGYTFVLGTSAALVVNPALFKTLPYDPFGDFILVAGLFRNPLLIVTTADSPYKSLADLVAAAKKAPATINWGVPGLGNTQHLTGELFKTMAGIDLYNIIYQGSAQFVTSLLGDQVQVGIDSVPSTLAHIQSGKLRALAMTGAERAPQLPDVPTVAELGYAGFVGEGFGGILLPASTPPEIVAKVSADVSAILQTPELQSKFINRGLIPYIADSKTWTAMAKTELGKWGGVAQRAGIKPQ